MEASWQHLVRILASGLRPQRQPSRDLPRGAGAGSETRPRLDLLDQDSYSWKSLFIATQSHRSSSNPGSSGSEGSLGEIRVVFLARKGLRGSQRGTKLERVMSAAAQTDRGILGIVLCLPKGTFLPASAMGGVTVSTGLLAAERHAGVWTPVIAHKTISAEPQFALAA